MLGQSIQGVTISKDSVTRNRQVIIFSHDLDDCSVLPHEVRKEFSLGEMSTLFVSNESLNIPKVASGLQFRKFLGVEVDGYFCTPVALLVGNLVARYQGEGLTVIQLVPEVKAYQQLATVFARLSKNKDLMLQASNQDTAAQRLGERCLINMIGLFSAMYELRDNPFLNESGLSTSEWVNSPRMRKYLDDHAFFMQFLREHNVDFYVQRFSPVSAAFSSLKLDGSPNDLTFKR